MQLTANFSLAEMTASQTATRQGIVNTPSQDVIDNLGRVAAVLEQIRALVGAPIHVSSGYRAPALNRAVGGAANSAHVLGLAADITVPSMTPQQLAKAIKAGGIEFDQLIYEGTWVHVGLATGAPRNQVLTATFTGGRASYSAGIA
ncbi:zinc D-Ala-D-Ala carboxypeptidase [Oxalobacteraceae bacterium GrIS 1.11]